MLRILIKVCRLVAARGFLPLARTMFTASIAACRDHSFHIKAARVRQCNNDWEICSTIVSPTAMRLDLEGVGIFFASLSNNELLIQLGEAKYGITSFPFLRRLPGWHQPRWLLHSTSLATNLPPKIWICGHGNFKWKLPISSHILGKIYCSIIKDRQDFRRRAKAQTDRMEARKNNVYSTKAICYLAGPSALNTPQVLKLLLAKAARGTLQIISLDTLHPFLYPSPNLFTIITDLGNNITSQNYLLGLNSSGRALAWLTANEKANVPEAEIPLQEACTLCATPAEEDGEDVMITPLPVIFHPNIIYRSRPVVPHPLRILSYRWHVPHQYELFKLEAEITLITDRGEDSCRWWDLGQRPLPGNVRFARWHEIDPQNYDIAFLHFDENVLDPTKNVDMVGPTWGKTFRFFREHLSIPQVAICHGAPPAATRFLGINSDSEKKAQQSRIDLINYLKNITVVINSFQAQSEWAFQNSRVIWHGFDPEEFPARFSSSNAPCRILTLPESALLERPLCRGSSLFEQVKSKLSAPLYRLSVPEPNLLLVGNAYAQAKFIHYIAALHQHDIYFNPTLYSPMPRSRGEAMLCGLVTVSVNNHDVEHFIQNGINGFFSDTAEGLAEQLLYLLAHPKITSRMGQASRKSAVVTFHIDRYLSDWRHLIRNILGSNAI